MSAKLDCGQYYGSIVRRLDLGPILLVETRHVAGTRVPAHAHRNAYFCLVQQGEYFERFDTRSRRCSPQTFAFHTPDETHSEQISGTDVRSLNVEVSAEWLRMVQELAPVLREPVACQGGAPAWLAARIYREFRWGDRASRLMIEGMLLEIAGELDRRASACVGQPPWLTAVRDLLHARFRDNVTLADIAAEAGTHPVHVAAVFRRYFGCSIGEYIRKCRVEFAASRLARRGMALADIAAEAGFADQSHFTRIFKRLTGLTPAAFRRSLNGN
jgi:AraC family transcriptional regulator